MLENILRLPAPAVTLVWLLTLLPIPWPRTFSAGSWDVTVIPIYSPALLAALVSFLWTYALYQASTRRVSPTSLRRGQRVFALAAISWAALAVLAHTAYVWNGQPPAALLIAVGLALAPAALSGIIAMFSASKALSKFEASATGPGDEQPWDPLLPILFIGLGIWFLRKRIERMLQHPPLAETAT